MSRGDYTPQEIEDHKTLKMLSGLANCGGLSCVPESRWARIDALIQQQLARDDLSTRQVQRLTKLQLERERVAIQAASAAGLMLDLANRRDVAVDLELEVAAAVRDAPDEAEEDRIGMGPQLIDGPGSYVPGLQVVGVDPPDSQVG